MLAANADLEGEIEKRDREIASLRSAAAAGSGAAGADGGGSAEALAELRGQLVIATSEKETKAAELMGCQELLAVTKSELLNLRMEVEERNEAAKAAAAAAPEKKFGGFPKFGKK